MPLSRAAFDARPVATHQNSGRPYWSADDLVPPNPLVHHVTLPRGRTGYHVLPGVWEMADAPNAFYQVVDLDIS